MSNGKRPELSVDIPETGNESPAPISRSQSTSTSRSKFSPVVVLDKLDPRKLGKITTKAVKKVRASVHPGARAARDASYRSRLDNAAEGKVRGGGGS